MALFDYFSEISFVVALFLSLYSVAFYHVNLYISSVVILYVCLTVIRRKTTGKVEVNAQGVFITGCDTGFGHDLSRRLDEIGFTVFAGCLRPEGEGAARLKAESTSRLHIVPLDVSSDESMASARDYVAEHLPSEGIWAIVSNAGFNVMGDIEWLTTNLYQKVMNVNFYGAIRMIQNFLYLVRRSKGRVVIVTSVKGLYPWPANSAYHVTKHGLETMADSLRMEMLKFDVKVAIVEPGNFSTATSCQNKEHCEHVECHFMQKRCGDFLVYTQKVWLYPSYSILQENFKRYKEEANEMWDNASPDVRAVYSGRSYLDAMVERQKTSIGGSAETTKPVVDALVDAIVSERPHTRYLVDGGVYGFDRYTTLARYYNYLPTWFSDWLIVKMTKCDTFVNQNYNLSKKAR